MTNSVFEWKLAGHPVAVSFLYPSTRFMLRPLPARSLLPQAQLFATGETVERSRQYLAPDSTDAYVEYRSFIGLSARWLLPFRASVFHAVAFLWRGRAWLLAAPSGTGKTTQYLNWQRLFPGEIEMISGDMPILEAHDDGRVIVHPSSWNGKENLFGAPAAPLGGLVYLEQGSEDLMLPFPPRDAVIPLFKQFMVVPETADEVYQLSDLIEHLLLAAPCRRFVNLGGDASTRLLRSTLVDFLNKESSN